jgi:ATP-binding cassette subfamily B (MDR/TAP) protein 6
MQNSNRSIPMLSFNRVIVLSLSWHMKRKTGELIGFTVIPAPVDICVALVVFVVRFDGRKDYSASVLPAQVVK